MVRSNAPKIKELFEIVASLNVHNHHAFASIVFSDTILIHNVPRPSSDEEHRYLVMYQCEFFQDLVHRLAGREISLRGVLTWGEFTHYRLNRSPYFYGPALIDAYEKDKSLALTGLVMDNHCKAFSDVFRSVPCDGWHYVFTTQGLEEWERIYGGLFPMPGELMANIDLAWRLGPEIETLAMSSRLAETHPDSRVQAKHRTTLELYERHYPRCFGALKRASFAMEAVCPDVNWQKVRERMKDDYSWAVVQRDPTPGSTGRRRKRS